MEKSGLLFLIFLYLNGLYGNTNFHVKNEEKFGANFLSNPVKIPHVSAGSSGAVVKIQNENIDDNTNLESLFHTLYNTIKTKLDKDNLSNKIDSTSLKDVSHDHNEVENTFPSFNDVSNDHNVDINPSLKGVSNDHTDVEITFKQIEAVLDKLLKSMSKENVGDLTKSEEVILDPHQPSAAKKDRQSIKTSTENKKGYLQNKTLLDIYNELKMETKKEKSNLNKKKEEKKTTTAAVMNSKKEVAEKKRKLIDLLNGLTNGKNFDYVDSKIELSKHAETLNQSNDDKDFERLLENANDVSTVTEIQNQVAKDDISHLKIPDLNNSEDELSKENVYNEQIEANLMDFMNVLKADLNKKINKKESNIVEAKPIENKSHERLRSLLSEFSQILKEADQKSLEKKHVKDESVKSTQLREIDEEVNDVYNKQTKKNKKSEKKLERDLFEALKGFRINQQ